MPTTTQSSSHIKPSVPRLVPHTGSHQSISVAGKRSPLPSRNNSPTNPDANTTTFPLANRKPEPGPDAPLNPDLPTKDVLFIFANFASYMRAPGQGHEGVDEAGLRHASRLLNYARDLQARPRSRIHILHIKYRYGPQSEDVETRRHTPPFSVLLDPVIKINCKPTGEFDPPPGAAVFDHIAKHVHPTPRYIVYSYVGSKFTNQQLAVLSTWCIETDPPIMILSPSETRNREDLPLEVALGDAIDISMYLGDEDDSPNPNQPDETLPSHPNSWVHSFSGRNWPMVRSMSGGSYLKGREEALRASGWSGPSYGSLIGQERGSGSWGSDGRIASARMSGSGPGLGGQAGNLGRKVRIGTLEGVVDYFGLGDDVQTIEEDATLESSDGGLRSPTNRLKRTPVGKSALRPRVGMRAHMGSGRDGRGGENNKDGETGNVSWRDLVMTHMDSSDPEFVQTYLD